MKTKNLIKIVASVLSVTGVIVAIGFGCGLAFEPVGEYDQSSVENRTGNIIGGGPGSPIVVVPGKLTVQVPRHMNMYNTLLSQLQVTTPSNATLTELTRQQGSFSESGQVTTINAGFTFAATSLSAAICLDRINLEVNQAADQRLFFNQVNLAGNPNLLSDAILTDVINRLARANWNRNQSAAEQATLLTAVKQSMDADAANNATETREAMLYLCTAVASSIAGYQM